MLVNDVSIQSMERGTVGLTGVSVTLPVVEDGRLERAIVNSRSMVVQTALD